MNSMLVDPEHHLSRISDMMACNKIILMCASDTCIYSYKPAGFMSIHMAYYFHKNSMLLLVVVSLIIEKVEV